MSGSRTTPNTWLGPPDPNHPFLHTRLLDPKSKIRNEDPQKPLFTYDRNLCTIEYLSLDNDPEFEALSYTWGSPFDPKAPSRRKTRDQLDYHFNHPRSYPLFINEDLFWMGESLDSALRHIRGHDSLTHHQVFAIVSAVYVNAGVLWFLTYCNQDPASIPPHIRSWVADWTRPHGYETIASNKGLRRWYASKDQKVCCECSMDGDEDVPRLSLDGVFVDTINWISELCPPISQIDLSPDGRAAILA
ncbi:hypothetical protein DL98DRAFT_586354 [Cadophora sp. DSE1049]|nr:hypothetical protein DL98DRAFT_586354 [Cadophora sp. DSE1049]